MRELFYAFITGMLVTLTTIPLLIRFAHKLQLVDVPDERKLHTGIVPRVGGLAMVVGTIISIVLWVTLDVTIAAFITSILVIAVFGVWDDHSHLSYRIKFLGQLVAALIVIFVGNIKITHIDFLYDGIIPDFISIPFTLFALLGITNAINLSDGLDGLAGGSSLFSLGVTGLLGYMTGNLDFVIITVAIMGSILGFLRFNTYPASVFMGDTGSQFLGFSLGVLVIYLTQQISPVLSQSIAIVILGLPILDTLLVMFQRISEGRSPFKPDRNHIHHKLLGIGLQHYEAVFVIYVLQSMTVVSAYMFRFYDDIAILGCFIIASISLVLILQNGDKYKDSIRKFGENIFINRLLEKRQFNWMIVRFCAGFIAILTNIYFILVIFRIEVVPEGVLYITVPLLVWIGLSCFITRQRWNEVSLRVGLYLTSTIIIYLWHTNVQTGVPDTIYMNIFFIILLVAIMIGLVTPTTEKASATPLDYIIIFIVIVLSNLPVAYFADSPSYAGTIPRLFILFYASEFVVIHLNRHVRLIKAGIITSLGILVLKTLA